MGRAAGEMTVEIVCTLPVSRAGRGGCSGGCGLGQASWSQRGSDRASGVGGVSVGSGGCGGGHGGMATVQGGHRVRHSLEKTDTQSVSERQRNSAEGRGLAYLGVFGWGAGLLQEGMVWDLRQCQSLRRMLGGGERQQLT